MLHTLVSKFSSILYISNFILKWPFPYVLNVLVALCDLSKKKRKVALSEFVCGGYVYI